MNEPILLSRILVTNDDGIDAPGIKTLIEVAEQFAEEVWVFAPEDDISSASARINVQEPIRVRKRGKNKYAVRGTPGDCVLLGIEHFMKDAKPDLVLSGINPNSNIATDVLFSGTIGATLASLMTGIPALAISQHSSGPGKTKWKTASAILPSVISHLLETGWRKDTILSINLPDVAPEEVTGLRWTDQGEKNHIGAIAHHVTSPRNDDYYWLEFKSITPTPTDNDEKSALNRGEISVTIYAHARSLPANKPPLRFKNGQFIEIEEDEKVSERDILDEIDGDII